MFRFLPLVFKNSLRNRRRSILTISSMAVSLCLLSVLLSMYHALFFGQATPGQALRLVVRNRVSLAQTMPVAYEQKILKVPGVVAVSPGIGSAAPIKIAAISGTSLRALALTLRHS